MKNKGVISAVSGYAGGEVDNPTYQDVKTGKTGHAEVVLVTFDPKIISFEEILTVFWKVHDPTTLNRQGGDKGTQYRSTIMYYTDEQKRIIEKSIEKEQMSYFNEIVTKVEAAPHFWVAEEYHQNYSEKNPDQRFVRLVVNPKVEKVKQLSTY